MCKKYFRFVFQAQRSWEQEQVEFANRRREHEIKMIEMEQVIKDEKYSQLKIWALKYGGNKIQHLISKIYSTL